MEKFLNFVEDIFEAEDNLPPEVDISDLPMSYFSQFSPDLSRPLLNCEIIAKLTKAIGKITRPAKRVRLASVQWDGATGSPRKVGTMSEVDIVTLSRLLKLLERSVHMGEDLDPFGALVYKKTLDPVETTSTQSSPVKINKGKTSKKGSQGNEQTNRRSKSPVHTHNIDRDGPSENIVNEVSEEELFKLKKGLDVARNCILAADCCLALLTSDKLAKQVNPFMFFLVNKLLTVISQLFSEDLITSCLVAVKNQLTRIIYPFIEAPASDPREYSPLLSYLLGRTPLTSFTFDLPGLRNFIGEIFQVISAVFPRINSLVCSERLCMPDSVIIPAIYVSLGPFFVADIGSDGELKGKKDPVALTISNTLGSSGMRGLRLEALALVRGVGFFL